MIAQIEAHSWIHCTDYKPRTETQTNYYDQTACHGHPRCGRDQALAPFGLDIGFAYRKKPRSNECQCGRLLQHAYTVETPRAVYQQGQEVCLAYPAQFHVAATCTDQYIPDKGVTIRRTGINAYTDDFSAANYTHQNGVHQNGVVDYKGYQNCPKFCEDQGKALCTMCFKLEDNLTPGTYSFQWSWNFHVHLVYNTCWEATVEEASENQTPNFMKTRTSTPIATPIEAPEPAEALTNVTTPAEAPESPEPVEDTPVVESPAPVEAPAPEIEAPAPAEAPESPEPVDDTPVAESPSPVEAPTPEAPTPEAAPTPAGETPVEASVPQGESPTPETEAPADDISSEEKKESIDVTIATLQRFKDLFS